jgi:hypothetical protein
MRNLITWLLPILVAFSLQAAEARSAGNGDDVMIGNAIIPSSGRQHPPEVLRLRTPGAPSPSSVARMPPAEARKPTLFNFPGPDSGPGGFRKSDRSHVRPPERAQ